MTPKEKAQKIYDDFALIYHPLHWDMKVRNCKQAKQCSIQCVENIKQENQYDQSTIDGYWGEVIEEIKNIGEKK